MRNLKKFLALVLAMMMTLSLMVTVNASSFKDVEDTNTYVEAIDMLAALGVLKGQGADADGEFQPKGTITRAEMAAVLYRVVTGDVKDKNVNLYGGYKSFTDLNDGAWYIPYVNYCENNGLINGVGGGKFEPQEKLTGYQALVMILRAMGYNNPNEFSSSDWKLKASGYGRRLGITNRISEGSLGAPIAREAVAEIVFQAIQKPTVSYNMLLGYTNDVLVAAYQNDDGWVYDHDVYNTLLYQVFGIVGKRTIYGGDGKYGRPMIDWVKDAKDDTVENGGKYIVNPQAPTTWKEGNKFTGMSSGNYTYAVVEGATYVPVATSGASYGVINTVDGAFAYINVDDNKDQTVVSTSLAPVYTFNKAMTECDLSKAINNDKKISWSDITEYVNGGLVVSRNNQDDDDGTTPHQPDGANAAEEYFDALHTTNTNANNKSGNTIGAAGRQTEIYNLGDVDNDDNDEWIFVYIDTLLGEVVKVVPHTLDTNDHVVTQAELWVAVNDGIDSDTSADDCIVMKQDANYTQTVGQLVTLTTWGMKDGVWNDPNFDKIGKQADDNGPAYRINEAILEAVPNAPAGGKTTIGTVNVWEDFQTVNNAKDKKAWAVEFASKSVGEPATVPTTTITVGATVGADNDKTGVIADGKTIPTTWAYHVDHDGATLADTNDKYHTAAGVMVDSTLDGRTVNVTNQIIGQTFTVALDKSGNILGMWQGTSDKIIGVVTDVDYVRVGLGKYAVEMEVFTTDSKTETVRLLNADDNNNYFPTQEEADEAIRRESNDKLGLTFTDDADGAGTKSKLNPKGALIELSSYTKDGATYWKIIDSCTATTAEDTINNNPKMGGAQDVDGIVVPGKADTLAGPTDDHDEIQVNDETVFIVAEYDFRYNTGSGNDGSNIDVRYKVYKSFRDIPVIDGAYATDPADPDTIDGFNIAFQVLDGKVTGGTDENDGEAKYVLITAIDPNEKYTQSNPKTINPDNSFLVIAPIATYAEYSEYSVARNGVMDTIKVANINGTVNADLQAAIRGGNEAAADDRIGLLVSISENGKGYITAVDEVKDIDSATNPNLGGHDNTLIGKGEGLKYSKGVLSWEDDNADGTINPNAYLTTAENCTVKIVNVDLGKMFDATLSAIDQYQADHDIVFELDSNGWVSCLYIID